MCNYDIENVAFYVSIIVALLALLIQGTYKMFVCTYVGVLLLN